MPQLFCNKVEENNRMKKNNYCEPYIVVLMRNQEDVICSSADTDIPFLPTDDDVYQDDIFNN